jgi:hypothetical protein
MLPLDGAGDDGELAADSGLPTLFCKLRLDWLRDLVEGPAAAGLAVESVMQGAKCTRGVKI